MRKIAIFTGSRSEYGLLLPILQKSRDYSALDLKIVAFVADNDELGAPVDEIERDGFKIDEIIRFSHHKTECFGESSVKQSDIVPTMGGIILDMSIILTKMRPDLLLVYGDRYEAFSAVIAGSQMNVPVVHMEGGDITMGGALDDSVRHAMTKLAHIHLVTNEQSKERVLKLGEEPWRVHNVGYPAIDLIKAGEYLTTEETCQRYNLKVDKPIVVCIQHSVTTEWEKAGEQVKPTLEALRLLSEEGIQVIILYPCMDAGGRLIIEEIEKLRGVENIQIHKNLPRGHFHGLLNVCGKYNGVCVGNSSSFIKEAGSFGVPVVNIGTRQWGRMGGDNLWMAGYHKLSVLETVKETLFNESVRSVCRDCGNPYESDGNTGEKVAELLATIDLNKKLLQKRMTY
jgi:UDP-N-acetylglucosamine 2-epimerase (non-hydrolysing)/GDP/UDP-N,N'-diacetylbacillosamine 2-epimerase (hydrolysing)